MELMGGRGELVKVAWGAPTCEVLCTLMDKKEEENEKKTKIHEVEVDE
jgi:hypothetical protein